MRRMAKHDLERIKANPSHLDGYASEVCDRCHSDLGDTAYRVNGSGNQTLVLCEDCVQPAERCDDCNCWRCCCPCPDCHSARCRCP